MSEYKSGIEVTIHDTRALHDVSNSALALALKMLQATVLVDTGGTGALTLKWLKESGVNAFALPKEPYLADQFPDYEGAPKPDVASQLAALDRRLVELEQDDYASEKHEERHVNLTRSAESAEGRIYELGKRIDNLRNAVEPRVKDLENRLNSATAAAARMHGEKEDRLCALHNWLSVKTGELGRRIADLQLAQRNRERNDATIFGRLRELEARFDARATVDLSAFKNMAPFKDVNRATALANAANEFAANMQAPVPRPRAPLDANTGKILRHSSECSRAGAMTTECPECTPIEWQMAAEAESLVVRPEAAGIIADIAKVEMQDTPGLDGEAQRGERHDW